MHGPRDSRVEDTAPLTGDLSRGIGEGKLLFLDAFSGIAGDMLVAALLDLGVPREPIDQALSTLPIEGYRIEVASVKRSGIVGRRFIVRVDEPQPDRSYLSISSMLQQADLPEGAQALALRTFRVLGEAEASTHGMPLEEVHFHEVGAVDSIVDVVAAAVGLDFIGARVVASPMPMGKGTVKARHGVLPLPPPATVACLKGVPTYDAGIDGELVTPTGASLVAASAKEFSRWPSMKPERVGWGAGTMEFPDRPNLLRVVLGTTAAELRDAESPFVVLEANVDDMTAEIVADAVERMLDSGALDVWTTPIGMKKGRPATMISALVQRAETQRFAQLILAETTSLGVRLRSVGRQERPRRVIEVETKFGRIPVKLAEGDGLPPTIAPEFEACRAAARAHGVPIKEVFAAALSEARRSRASDRTEPDEDR